MDYYHGRSFPQIHSIISIAIWRVYPIFDNGWIKHDRLAPFFRGVDRSGDFFCAVSSVLNQSPWMVMIPEFLLHLFAILINH